MKSGLHWHEIKAARKETLFSRRAAFFSLVNQEQLGCG